MNRGRLAEQQSVFSVNAVGRMLVVMAKFGPMVFSGHGLEIFLSAKKPTKKSGRKVWFRIQGANGSTFRVYESLSYARSIDVCFQEDTTLRPKKPRRTGPP